MAYYYSPFRNRYQQPNPAGATCPFCNTATMDAQTVRRTDGSLVANAYYRFVVNTFPKFEGHTMLVPHEHLLNFTDESPASVQARHEILIEAATILRKAFPGAGIEHFIQTGDGSMSSVAHLHWHVVPASSDDELRSFEKLGHFYTTVEHEEKVVLFPKTITMEPAQLLQHLHTHATP